MLVLNIKVGDNIVINDNIIVKVIKVHGGQASLGIQAPRNIQVDREEIYLRKQKERNYSMVDS